MKCSLGMSNFLEEISNLSHSIVFLYALITEEVFLISPWYLCNSAFTWVYLSFSPLLFTSLLFTALCKAPSDSHFACLHFFFLGWSWFLSPVQCHVEDQKTTWLPASDIIVFPKWFNLRKSKRCKGIFPVRMLSIRGRDFWYGWLIRPPQQMSCTLLICELQLIVWVFG